MSSGWTEDSRIEHRARPNRCTCPFWLSVLIRSPLFLEKRGYSIPAYPFGPQRRKPPPLNSPPPKRSPNPPPLKWLPQPPPSPPVSAGTAGPSAALAETAETTLGLAAGLLLLVGPGGVLVPRTLPAARGLFLPAAAVVAVILPVVARVAVVAWTRTVGLGLAGLAL